MIILPPALLVDQCVQIILRADLGLPGIDAAHPQGLDPCVVAHHGDVGHDAGPRPGDAR